MKSEKFVIQGTLATLNEYTKANRGNKYAGAGIKKVNTDLVALYAKSQLRGKYERIHLDIKYVMKDKRKDKDNIAFAKKFILDGLVKAGIIKNDGWQEVEGWTETFEVDSEERIEITITEVS